MWKLENGLQLIAFLTCISFGALYCLLYDVIRALRKNKRYSDFAVAVQDILFFVFAALITFLLFLKFTLGEIRLYIFVALALGFFLFRITLSRFITPILIKLFGVLKGVISVFLRSYRAFRNKIYEFLSRCAEKMKKYCKNALKNLKNILQHKY